MGTRVEECRFQGEPGLRLVAGELAATFLPGVGMTGVSLRYGSDEHLAVPGGVPALRAGATAGLPLLAPWANRLSSPRYRVGRIHVDLREYRVPTDSLGLPIHGLLVGQPGWRVETCRVRGKRAILHASIDVDAPAFPFPHRIDVAATALEDRVDLRTTLVPTGRRRVPAAFGWHPYLRLPGASRSRWTLRLPSRRHLALDARGIPTGFARHEDAEAAPIRRRTFDDLYALGSDRRLSLETDAGSAIVVRCGTGYEYAQVWVPERRPYAALEPMVASTNALVEGTAPLVPPGDSFAAGVTLAVRPH